MTTSGVALACYDCALPYDHPAFADFVVADYVWLMISPTGHEGGILCANCMVRRAVELGIEAEGRFVSGPFADHNWIKPIGDNRCLAVGRLGKSLRQCMRGAGHGPDGDLCYQHALIHGGKRWPAGGRVSERQSERIDNIHTGK